jgi:hypothetical protein
MWDEAEDPAVKSSRWVEKINITAPYLPRQCKFTCHFNSTSKSTSVSCSFGVLEIFVGSDALRQRLTLDGVEYHRIAVDSVTQGWVSDNVKIRDGHGDYMVEMYGGTVGMDSESSGDHRGGLDTVKPFS